MVMRLIIVFVLLAALTGCLKNAADEGMSGEPAVTEEAVSSQAPDTAMEPQAGQEKSVSVEPAEALEKPGAQDIQEALKNANLYEGKIDGVIGPKTREAIEAFQSKNGLKVDGKVGPKTWEKLKEYLSK